MPLSFEINFVKQQLILSCKEQELFFFFIEQELYLGVLEITIRETQISIKLKECSGKQMGQELIKAKDGFVKGFLKEL